MEWTTLEEADCVVAANELIAVSQSLLIAAETKNRQSLAKLSDRAAQLLTVLRSSGSPEEK